MADIIIGFYPDMDAAWAHFPDQFRLTGSSECKNVSKASVRPQIPPNSRSGPPGSVDIGSGKPRRRGASGLEVRPDPAPNQYQVRWLVFRLFRGFAGASRHAQGAYAITIRPGSTADPISTR